MLSGVHFCEDPVGRKFVLLVDCDGLGMGSLLTGSIVRDLIGVMQAASSLVQRGRRSVQKTGKAAGCRHVLTLTVRRLNLDVPDCIPGGLHRTECRDFWRALVNYKVSKVQWHETFTGSAVQ